MIADLCTTVDYGSHIGEYIRIKIKEQGRNITWLSEELDMSRQNFSRNWLDKAELKPSQIHQLEKALGEDFFDEFFEKNKAIKRYPQETAEIPQTKTPQADYQRVHQGSGYSLSIQIDPVNFNPDHMEPLSKSLRKALEEFKREIEGD